MTERTTGCPLHTVGPDEPAPALPPGPRLPVAVQTWLLRVATPAFLRWCRSRYGDVFTVHDAVGGNQVFLADPEHIRTVFTGDPELMRAGEGNGILGPILGRRSVLLLDGAEHRERRRLMLPAFHGEPVRRQEPLIREVVTTALAGWPVGRAFAAHERTREVALEIILRVVLGTREPELRAALPRVVDLSPADLLMIAYPRLTAVGRWRRYWEHKALVHRLLDAEIERRCEDPEPAAREDVLSSLVRAYLAAGEPTDDGDLRDQLITLLLAGHETTATALAWALELLARNPSRQDELAGSVLAGSSEYANAVVTETLRIRPVISLVARHIHRPVRLGDVVVPGGVTLCPAIALVQADGGLHPEPDSFDPRRWLGPDAARQGMVLPFGGGVRRCLGAPFAVAELRVAVEEIVRRYQVHPVGRRPERVRMRHITAVPSRGARIRLTPRS
jgi:cytochrome P450 family 135